MVKKLARPSAGNTRLLLKLKAALEGVGLSLVACWRRCSWHEKEFEEICASCEHHGVRFTKLEREFYRLIVMSKELFENGGEP